MSNPASKNYWNENKTSITEIWRSGTIEEKLNTYGLKNLVKLALRKNICGCETMPKEELVGKLKDVTLIEDLPIR